MTLATPIFPVTLPTRWKNPHDCILSDTVSDWLLDPSSLTIRLKSLCHSFHVEVLGQVIEPCSELESSADIPVGSDVLVREVLLYCDNVPHVFARSLLPLSTLTGEEKQLAELGNQSLGQVLFNSAELQRKSIEVSSFDENSGVGKLANKLTEGQVDLLLWGRRSIFLLNQKPLMVSEVFLPTANMYQL